VHEFFTHLTCFYTPHYEPLFINFSHISYTFFTAQFEAVIQFKISLQYGFAMEMDFEFKLESTDFSPRFRHNVNAKAVQTVSACFTNDKTRTVRARAPISLHSQWIHKYKLLNFVTRFKFAPTGEETWSWIHCLIRRTSRRCTKYVTVYTRAYTERRRLA